MAEGEWMLAAEHWRAALAAAPAPPPWRHAYARCLQRTGRWEAATAELERLLAETPDDDRLSAGLARARVMAAEAAMRSVDEDDELVVGLKRRHAASAALDVRLEAASLLAHLGDVVSAREVALPLYSRAETVRQCRRLLSLAAMVLLPSQQGAALGELLGRVTDLRIAEQADNGFVETQLQLLLRLDPFGRFLEAFPALSEEAAPTPRVKQLRRVRDRLAAPSDVILGEAKVFGIGLSKTGTTSLSIALTRLGVDNAHWSNPLTGAFLSDIDFYMLGGATDTPVSARFEQLARTYPNARFVLTERPLPEWRASFAAHMLRTRNCHQTRRDRGTRYGMEAAMVDYGLYLGHASPEAAYDAHTRQALRIFAHQPERLLRFDVFSGHGWPELCAFLGVPPPAAPFPVSNQRPEPA